MWPNVSGFEAQKRRIMGKLRDFYWFLTAFRGQKVASCELLVRRGRAGIGSTPRGGMLRLLYSVCFVAVSAAILANLFFLFGLMVKFLSGKELWGGGALLAAGGLSSARS